jgi:hypothetical protein
MPDARHVSKARLLSQTLRYPEVADLAHHCLSACLLVPMQDWAFLHRCRQTKHIKFARLES